MESHDDNAVVLVDPTGTIRHWSPGATALFGHPDVSGQTLDVIVPEAFRDMHWNGFRRAMATGESKVSGDRRNIPVLCADGEVRAFPGTFTVLWDAHQRPTGAIGIWSARRGDEEPFSEIQPF
jgi:PAS domain S-box-containing protein